MTIVVNSTSPEVAIQPPATRGASGPANQLTLQGTTTLAAGSNASVTIGGTAPNQTIAFAIPRGAKILTGSVSPAAPGVLNAANSDIYIRTNGKIYQVQSSAWVEIADFEGPPGENAELRYVAETETVQTRVGDGAWSDLFLIPSIAAMQSLRNETIEARDIAVAAAESVDFPDASETVKGVIELATTAEATAGSDTARAVTPAGLAAALAATPGKGIRFAVKSAGYTVVAGDADYRIECTGTFTLTLTDAATLTSNFSFWVSNAGTGTITIDPASAELIDGAATLDVLPGHTRLVQCTGTAWETTKFTTGNWHQYGASQVVSSPVASVVFSSIPTGATDLKLVWSGASHNNGAAAEISIDISDDNGSNYRTGLGSTGGFVAASDAHSGVMFLTSYRDGLVRNEGAYSSDAAATRTDGSNYGGARPNIKIAGVNAIRLLPSAGSIDAGTFTLFIRG